MEERKKLKHELKHHAEGGSNCIKVAKDLKASDKGMKIIIDLVWSCQ